jgi:CheY-like chemotaxis protein
VKHGESATRGARVLVVEDNTGYGRDEDRRPALAAGFDHHLVKPVNPEALLALVAGLPPASRARTLQ